MILPETERTIPVFRCNVLVTFRPPSKVTEEIEALAVIVTVFPPPITTKSVAVGVVTAAGPPIEVVDQVDATFQLPSNLE